VGIEAVFYHLLNLDLSGFNPHEHALDTLAKEIMKDAVRTDVGAWCELLKRDPSTALFFAPRTIRENCDLFSAKQLRVIFEGPDRRGKWSDTYMGRTLKSAGFEHVCGGALVNTHMGPQRLYAVRNQEIWKTMSPTEVAKHVNRFYSKEGGYEWG